MVTTEFQGSTRPKCAYRKCDEQSWPGSKYCRSCKEHRGRNSNNARQAFKRFSKFHALIVPDDEVGLETILASLTTSPREMNYVCSTELDALDASLERDGPYDSKLRNSIRECVPAIMLGLSAGGTNLDHLYIRGRCISLLRDAGVESTSDVSQLLRYGKEAVDIYKSLKDYRNVARALIAYANSFRLAGREKVTAKMMHWAISIAREKCDPKDMKVKEVLHQATLWNVRYPSRDKSRDSDVELLRELAEELDTPSVWLQTWRSLAGYWIAKKEPEKAWEPLSQLDALLRQHSFPIYGEASLVRVKIEAFLATGDRESAARLILEDFLPRYGIDFHVYHYDQLRLWREGLGLSFTLSRPRYQTAILTYLPRQ